MKRYLVLIGVGIAFVAVSLWVWLSRGKCASAVRTKFRLGGIILTLTSTMALGGCRLMMTCYDMPEPERTDDEVSPRFNDYYKKYTDVVMNDDGELEKRHFVTFKAVTDERICDGYYYASAFKIIKRHLLNPELLDEPVAEVLEDID